VEIDDLPLRPGSYFRAAWTEVGPRSSSRLWFLSLSPSKETSGSHWNFRGTRLSALQLVETLPGGLSPERTFGLFSDRRNPTQGRTSLEFFALTLPHCRLTPPPPDREVHPVVAGHRLRSRRGMSGHTRVNESAVEQLVSRPYSGVRNN